MKRAAFLVALTLLGTAAAAAQTAGEPSDLAAVVAMVESGRLQAAEAELQRLLAGGEDPVTRDLLGVVLGRQDRAAEAEEQFRRALAADSDYAPARQHLARLYLAAKRNEEALEQLRLAARLGPLERDLGLQLASFEYAAGNPQAAQEQLSSVAESYSSVRALLELARIHTSQGDHREALESLRRALQLAPNSEAVLSAHARVSLAAQAPIPAIWTFEHLERMHSEDVEYAYLLGVARMQVGEMTGAVEALRSALDLAPDRALTLIALGIALNGQKRFAEAETILTRSLLLAPDNVEAMAAMAEAKEGLGALDAAERYVERALARAPSHSRAQLVLGKIRMSQERFAEARDALSRAIAADPTSTKARYQLSLAYARLGDPENSRRHLEMYREALKEAEARLIELRRSTGTETGGMS